MSKPFPDCRWQAGRGWGKAPKPQEQPKQDVPGTNAGNVADEQSADTNKETEDE